MSGAMERIVRRLYRSPGHHTPRLWSVWLAAPAVVLVSAGVVWLIYKWMYSIAPVVELKSPTGEKRFGVDKTATLRLSIAVSGAVGAVLAGLYAYRKQKLSEGDARRADGELFATKYGRSAELLGHDSAAVRLAGVYAVARLADDWYEQRQVCIDVLCAYLRMPYEPDASSPAYRHGEREVRLTILEVIRQHITAEQPPHRSWRGFSLDFRGAIFDGGSLAGAKFVDGIVDFSRATFLGDGFDLSGADFSGARVLFESARFESGFVSLCGSTFKAGTLHFAGCYLVGGNLNFTSAVISGAKLDFSGATFRSGSVDLQSSQFILGGAVFDESTVSGANFDFRGTAFRGGYLSFSTLQLLDGNIAFGGSEFIGTHVNFDHAELVAGTLNFASARHDGGPVTFDGLLPHRTRIEWGPFAPAI